MIPRTASPRHSPGSTDTRRRLRAGTSAEPFVKIERGDVDMGCHILHRDLLRYMLFHKINRIPDRLGPIHMHQPGEDTKTARRAQRYLLWIQCASAAA